MDIISTRINYDETGKPINFTRTLVETRPAISSPPMGSKLIHTVAQGRSCLVYPHQPTIIRVNSPINWRLIVIGGSITILPYNDWLKRVLRFFGLKKIRRAYEDQE